MMVVLVVVVVWVEVELSVELAEVDELVGWWEVVWVLVEAG
jgi:hypothetical protein